MKKLFALLLSIVMTLALAVPALAAPSSGAVTPTPPDWMPAEHYQIGRASCRERVSFAV